MGIGGSIAAIALGAILTFAVSVQDPQGININTIGIILMIVGVIGLLFTTMIWGRRRDVVVDGGRPREVVTERREVV